MKKNSQEGLDILAVVCFITYGCVILCPYLMKLYELETSLRSKVWIGKAS